MRDGVCGQLAVCTNLQMLEPMYCLVKELQESLDYWLDYWKRVEHHMCRGVTFLTRLQSVQVTLVVCK